jgi:ATP-dependent exoDNAse (exonuclease V) beta subunit
METLGREVVVHEAGGDGTVRELRIDRLLRDDSGLVVLDYKSGRPEGERVERDRDQVTRYCEAVSKLSGLPCRGLVWYVGADADALIDAGGEAELRIGN